MSSPHREEEFTTPPPLFAGATVFILGGGPSLRGFGFDRLLGRRVIAVNSSCLAAPWAEVLYFMDSGWFGSHREIVEGWPGAVFTASRAAKRELPDKVHRIRHEERPDFPPPGSPFIRGGRSSGHMAVSLALSMGAARIALLGFDMRVADGRSHHHDDYARQADPVTYAGEFIPGFDGWHATALAAGCQIVNATPGSALKEFPMADLDAELGACAA